MRDRKRNSMWGTLGIAGLLILTSACDNKPPNPASTTPGSKNSGSGPSVGDSGSNTQSLSGPQNDKQVITTCSDLSQEDCEKTLFGLQRCKKDGDKCVDNPPNKSPESCEELEEDDCNKSLACKYDSSECKDDNTYRIASCEDKDIKDCKDECRADTVLPVCLKNERSGRCVFDLTNCACQRKVETSPFEQS